MKTFFGKHPLVRLTLSCAILASITLASAPASRAESSADRHARKVHARLQKYRAGSYLHLVLRDKTNEYGALGGLTDASFSFKSADSNAVAAISYADVADIRTDREPIGEGTGPEHHIRVRTLVIVGALAAGAAVAAVEVR